MSDGFFLFSSKNAAKMPTHASQIQGNSSLKSSMNKAQMSTLLDPTIPCQPPLLSDKLSL